MTKVNPEKNVEEEDQASAQEGSENHNQTESHLAQNDQDQSYANIQLQDNDGKDEETDAKEEPGEGEEKKQQQKEPLPAEYKSLLCVKSKFKLAVKGQVNWMRVISLFLLFLIGSVSTNLVLLSTVVAWFQREQDQNPALTSQERTVIVIKDLFFYEAIAMAVGIALSTLIGHLYEIFPKKRLLAVYFTFLAVGLVLPATHAIDGERMYAVAMVVTAVFSQAIMQNPLICDYVKKHNRGFGASFQAWAKEFGQFAACGIMYEGFTYDKTRQDITFYAMTGVALILGILTSLLFVSEREVNRTYVQDDKGRIFRYTRIVIEKDPTKQIQSKTDDKFDSADPEQVRLAEQQEQEQKEEQEQWEEQQKQEEKKEQERQAKMTKEEKLEEEASKRRKIEAEASDSEPEKLIDEFLERRGAKFIKPTQTKKEECKMVCTSTFNAFCTNGSMLTLYLMYASFVNSMMAAKATSMFFLWTFMWTVEDESAKVVDTDLTTDESVAIYTRFVLFNFAAAAIMIPFFGFATDKVNPGHQLMMAFAMRAVACFAFFFIDSPKGNVVVYTLVIIALATSLQSLAIDACFYKRIPGDVRGSLLSYKQLASNFGQLLFAGYALATISVNDSHEEIQTSAMLVTLFDVSAFFFSLSVIIFGGLDLDLHLGVNAREVGRLKEKDLSTELEAYNLQVATEKEAAKKAGKDCPGKCKSCCWTPFSKKCSACCWTPYKEKCKKCCKNFKDCCGTLCYPCCCERCCGNCCKPCCKAYCSKVGSCCKKMFSGCKTCCSAIAGCCKKCCAGLKRCCKECGAKCEKSGCKCCNCCKVLTHEERKRRERDKASIKEDRDIHLLWYKRKVCCCAYDDHELKYRQAQLVRKNIRSKNRWNWPKRNCCCCFYLGQKEKIAKEVLPEYTDQDKAEIAKEDAENEARKSRRKYCCCCCYKTRYSLDDGLDVVRNLRGQTKAEEEKEKEAQPPSAKDDENGKQGEAGDANAQKKED